MAQALFLMVVVARTAQDSLRQVHTAEVVANAVTALLAVAAAVRIQVALLSLGKVRAAAAMAARIRCKLPLRAQTPEAAAEEALRTQVIPAARAALESCS
jgi:hypothetical protein